jgi:hypothetical protein
MRQGSNGRRPRGRPQRKQHGGTQRHGNFDSSGPEGRVRGNAHQVYEKYIGLARDATSMGDRVAAETYYQYAEHYYRIVNVRPDPKPNGDGQTGRRGGDEQPEPPPLNGEQPQEARQAQEAEDRPAPQRRRRPRQAKAAEPQPDSKADSKPDPQPAVQASPEAPAKPEAPANKDGDSAET